MNTPIKDMIKDLNMVMTLQEIADLIGSHKITVCKWGTGDYSNPKFEEYDKVTRLHWEKRIQIRKEKRRADNA